MSGTREDALFTDPLEALRAADHRPLVERLRDRTVAAVRFGSLADHVRSGAVALGTVAVLVAIAWRLFVTSQPPIEDSLPIVQRSTTVAPAAAVPAEVRSEGSSTAATVLPEDVVVHVAGGVHTPGLVFGSDGWRVYDAIEAAGGLTPNADPDRINLAAPIADGQRVFVPIAGEPVIPALAATPGAASVDPATTMVDINSADSVALQQLPGVGPATAERILSHREDHGPFATVDSLVAVRGIGPATLEGIRDHATVG